MKSGFDTFRLHIKKYTTETIPFKRLMEYLSQLEKIFNNEDVHFIKVAKGSAAPEFLIKNEEAYKIEERINSLKDLSNPDYCKLLKLLQEDKTDAFFTRNNKRILEIKSANDNILRYDIKQAEDIYGYVMKVGGIDDTVPLCIKDLYDETILYNCTTTKTIAKEIAKYLFETPVKLSGFANWIKVGDSKWDMKKFIVKSFEIIDDDITDIDTNQLFEIDTEWYKNNTVEDFIKEMRGDNE